MRIAILSRNPKLYSTRRLKEAAIQRGHEVQILNTSKCYMDIASHDIAGMSIAFLEQNAKTGKTRTRGTG